MALSAEQRRWITRISRTSFSWLVILLAKPASAVDYALLVGVSDYPALGEKQQLLGPKNDVTLMRDVLMRGGLDPAHVRILADGVGGAQLPTRSAVLGALEQLVERMGEGDRLYLHLSGHASQQPNGPRDTDHEPDGLDEVFLPRDVGSWSPKEGAIENGIEDDELGELIGRMLAKGGSMWLVADTCNAGTIVRGALPAEIRHRGIDSASLGVPSETGGKALGGAGWSTASFDVQVAALGDTTRSARLQTDAPANGFVAFYAARAGEPEPEMPLPEDAEDNRWHGLLTHRLAEALSAAQQAGHAITYRQLGERIRQRYMGRVSPTPLFEGTGLESKPIGADSAGADERAWQWAIHKPIYPAVIQVPVGRLARIGEGSRFALLARPDDDIANALGFAEVSRARDLSAELEPIAARGKVALETDAIPANAYARLVSRAIDFMVRVARPALPENASNQELVAAALIDRLARERTGEGIKLQWVAPTAAADLRLGFTPRNRNDCEIEEFLASSLWLAESDGGIRCDGAIRSISIDLERPEAEIRSLMLDTIQRIAKVLNLNRIAERVAVASTGELVGVDLRMQPHAPNEQGKERPVRLTPDAIARPQPGDRLSLDLKNTSQEPMDINIFFVDGIFKARSRS
jgi:hypothetical protein